MTALRFAVIMLVSFIGFIPMLMIIMPAFCAFFGALPFMLFPTRAKRFGMVTIMDALPGLPAFPPGRP